MTTQTTWQRYTIANGPSFQELLSDTEPAWPTNTEIKVAGFDPDDEEISVSYLRADWNGHKAGARIIHSLQLEGYPFAVEVGAF